MKKYFIHLALCYFGCFLGLLPLANAQTVSKVNGDEVIVNFTSNPNLKTGESVTLLDDKLEARAKGTVLKVSENKKTVIVKIKSGTASTGQTLESDDQTGGSPLKKESSRPLTAEEQKILSDGEISDTAYIIGGLLGTYPGLGIGHAVQGRYSDKGWIFTVGEVGSFLIIVRGLTDCIDDHPWTYRRNCDSGLIALGAAAYIGFRIWEIIDVWATPPSINRRYRALRQEQAQNINIKLTPFVANVTHNPALGLGLNLSF